MNTQTTLKNSCLGLIFLVPFVPLVVASMGNGLFFPFITGKGFALRIIVEILVALWVLLMLRDKKYAPHFSWISLTVTLFTAAILVTDLAGLNPLRSIWSNFERMEGWMTIIHLWAYFIAATSIFGKGDEGRHKWHTFFNVSLVAAAVVGMYGFVQLFGWAPIHQGSTRIDASLGNAAYMAVYMLIHIFFAGYLFFVRGDKSDKSQSSRSLFRFIYGNVAILNLILVIYFIALKIYLIPIIVFAVIAAILYFIYRSHKAIMPDAMEWVYALATACFTFLLFETATRGTILGFVGGGMLSLAIYAVFGKKESKAARGISAGIIAVIILLGVGLVAAKDAAFVKNQETLNRLASISFSDTKTQARGYIWPMAVNSIFSNPKTAILGVGQENFNYIFNANYNPEMWNQEQWFDRAHSVFLDWLVAGGLLGALLYIALFVMAVISLWKTHLAFAEKSLFTGLLVGYAIHNIFVFDNLSSYILFFSILGFVHSLSSGKSLSWFEKKDHQSENAIVVRDYIFLPLVVIIFAATMYFVNVRPIQANMRLIAAYAACANAPSAELYERALALNQTVANQEIHEQILGCARNVITSQLPQTIKAQFYMLAQKAVAAQIASAPEDARGYVIGGGFFNEITDFKSATPLLEKAHALSPKKQSISYQLALNYMNSGREKEGTELLKNAYNDAKNNTEIAITYTSALILLGDDAGVQEMAAAHPEIANNERILLAYTRVKKFDKVIAGYKALIAEDPKNIPLYGRLTKAYVDSGRKDLAYALLDDMKVKFPELLQQINDIIKEIRDGKIQ